MPIRPDLSRLTVSQLHELTGRDRRWLKERLAEKGVVPIEETARERQFAARGALEAVYCDGELLDPSQEQARLARARSELAEHELAERRGEYVAGSAVDLFLFRVCGGMAQRMSAIPTKAAPEVRATASDAEGQDVLRTHIDQALNEIADDCRAAGESVEARKRGEVRRSIVDPKGAERKRTKAS